MKNLRGDVEQFYTDVLGSLRVEVEKDGRCMLIHPDDSRQEAVVNDKPLYVPVKGTLDGGMIDKVQHFHPLCESLARKTPSPVIEYMKTVAKRNIGIYTKVIMEKLMTVACNPDLQDELPAATTGYLKKVPNATEKMLKKLETLITKAIRKNKFVNVYCRSGGKYDGEPVTRLCTIRFPIMEMVANDDCQSLKVSFSSKRERETILALMEYAIPGGRDHLTYSAGSNSQVAPFFEAFLLAYGKITAQLNSLIKRHGSSMDLQLDTFKVDVLKQIDRLPEFYEYSRIPSLSGNEGGLKEMEQTKDGDRDDAPKAAADVMPMPSTRHRNSPTSTHTESSVPVPSSSVKDHRNNYSGGQQNAPTQSTPSSANRESLSEYLKEVSGSRQQPPQHNYYQQQPPQSSGFSGLRQQLHQTHPHLATHNGQQQPMDYFQQANMQSSYGYQQPRAPQNNGYYDPANGII